MAAIRALVGQRAMNAVWQRDLEQLQIEQAELTLEHAELVVQASKTRWWHPKMMVLLYRALRLGWNMDRLDHRLKQLERAVEEKDLV